MAHLSIIIGKTVEGKLYFRIRNESGRILLTSREYAYYENCLNEIYGMQVYTNFEFATEKLSNGYQYTLTGSWNRVVATSPVYRFLSDLKKDIAELKENIGRAEVVDNSSTIRYFRPVRI